MSSKGRDFLKLGGIIAVAFVAGLFFATGFGLPRPGQAESAHPVNIVTGPRAPLKTVDGIVPSFADIAERVRPSVVYVQIQKTERTPNNIPPEFRDFFHFQGPSQPHIREGSGSGFIVSEDGYILTNNHVVADADKVTVTLLDNREFTAHVVGRDPRTDVAVIKIDANHLTPLAFGNSDDARIGDWVLAIGNPLNLMFTVTAGIVSAKGRGLAGLGDNNDSYQIQDFIQTDAAINPGNSGGPLVDLQGEVIGINAAIASQTGFYAGYGFAVPINLARRVMDDLIATGRVQRAALGVAIKPIKPEDADAVGLTDIRGVVVDYFSGNNSPAKAAGIQQGDVIVALNDTAIDHVAQLQTMVGFKHPGEVVRVTIVRSRGERQTYDVHLIPAESDSAQVASASGGRSKPAAPTTEASTKLGITLEDMTSDIVREAGLSEDQRGPVVSDIEEGGPSWDNKLVSASSGSGPDVVLWVNGTRVHTTGEFLRAIHDVKSGEVVTLRVENLSNGLPTRVVRIRVR
ncbi:MAG: Do family serine endopeptidase [Gemmatimonadales bacterium]|jgi:serine protease Do